MTINRDLLDEYLDGQLAPAQMAQIDQALKADAVAAALLAQMQRQRAVRRNVFAAYEPTPADAAKLSTLWLADFAAAEASPIAHIGPRHFFRWAGAVAAALIVMAGGFVLGRGTAPAAPTVAIAPPPAVQTIAAVKYLAPDVNGDMQEYSSAGDAKRAWENVLAAMDQQKSSTEVADADGIAPNGSF
jgi:anti-sigma factor RsiW